MREGMRCSWLADARLEHRLVEPGEHRLCGPNQEYRQPDVERGSGARRADLDDGSKRGPSLKARGLKASELGGQIKGKSEHRIRRALPAFYAHCERPLHFEVLSKRTRWERWLRYQKAGGSCALRP